MQNDHSDHRKTRVGRRAAGRPKHFNVDALRDVWVYVQAWAVVTGRPVSDICSSKNASFSWLAANVPGFKNGLRVDHEVARETLRRRYYEAVRYLKEESKPYRILHEAGWNSSASGAISPLEEWWCQLRDEEIARIKKSVA
jgi:hypothetical protein